MKEKQNKLIIKIIIPILLIIAAIITNIALSINSKQISDKAVILKCNNTSSIYDSSILQIADVKSYGNIEGLNGNFGFCDGDNALISIGLTSDEFYKKYPDSFEKLNSNKLNDLDNDLYGKMYLLKLSSLEKKPLNIKTMHVFSDMLPKSGKVYCYDDKDYFIYDLKKDVKNNINNDNIYPENISNWSKNGNYLISLSDTGLKVTDVNNNKTKNINIDKAMYKLEGSIYSDDEENIYCIGEKINGSKNRQGIFKININNCKLSDIFTVPNISTYSLTFPDKSYNRVDNTLISKNADSKNDNSIFDFSKLDDEGRIIFCAIIDGKEGIYIYNTKTKKLTTAVNGHARTKDGIYYPSSIWISPDKTKIIYTNISENKCNLYAAKIDGDSLKGKVCIYSDITFSGNVSKVEWDSSSKKILFFTADDVIEKNKFSFTDKNSVNIITFK